MIIAFKWINEQKPGVKWRKLFERTWPFYQRWFISEGVLARPGYLSSVSALEEYMPELLPVYQALCYQAGNGDLEARFLSMYCPPPYLTACSQIAWVREGQPTSLIRNYDYSPRMFEGVMLYSNWLKPVIGISDCTWGLLDGMNADGLAVSLTFGGRKVVGHGFGIPILLRYVLETCSDVATGLKALCRIPVHMSYNVTLLDRMGTIATVYLAPDREPVILSTPVCTNHQKDVEWQDYADMTGTVERESFLNQCLQDPYESSTSLIGKFLRPPLYNTHFEKAFGTLYTAVYDLETFSVKTIWPEKQVTQSFQVFTEQKIICNPLRHIHNQLTK
jgi:predicted choloylglycine hydrolase